jgi:lipoate-protein ligase B
MNWFAGQIDPDATVAQFHLLGRVDFESVLALQQRLVFEAGESVGRQITVLICEHPEVLTIGRNGSRAHIRLSEQQLARRRLPIRWVGRGGGCILHAPGQLAVYPLVPLERLGWSVGGYMRRLQRGFADAFKALGVTSETRPSNSGIWGRKGLLVAMGVAVRDWITYHGAFLNVSPAMNAFGYVDTGLVRIAGNGEKLRESCDATRAAETECQVRPDRSAETGETPEVCAATPEVCTANAPPEKATMSCLLAETGRGVTMSRVRAQLVASLAEAFDCDRHHFHTGHPLLARAHRAPRDSISRAS